uniref:Uncharacterized protein n=1 Tax=Rhizophora mucronata TaxID=61149 RepID=A0A2P2PFA5_RHIMU
MQLFPHLVLKKMRGMRLRNT